MDEHIKSVHGQSNAKPSTFQCDKCDQTFDARAKLRVHNEKKHLSKQSSYQCENCDKVFPTQGQKNVHMNECTAGFETVKTSLCRYFMNGYCLKGSSCTFSHQLNSSAPYCRNGVCSFFHPGVGIQRPRFSEQTGFRKELSQNMASNRKTQFNRPWCIYMMD